jgi:hypothetical protein
LSIVAFATESSVAEPEAKKMRRPTLRMKSCSVPACTFSKPAAGSLVSPVSLGLTPGSSGPSILAVVQAARSMRNPAASSRRKCSGRTIMI